MVFCNYQSLFVWLYMHCISFKCCIRKKFNTLLRFHLICDFVAWFESFFCVPELLGIAVATVTSLIQSVAWQHRLLGERLFASHVVGNKFNFWSFCIYIPVICFCIEHFIVRVKCKRGKWLSETSQKHCTRCLQRGSSSPLTQLMLMLATTDGSGDKIVNNKKTKFVVKLQNSCKNSPWGRFVKASYTSCNVIYHSSITLWPFLVFFF